MKISPAVLFVLIIISMAAFPGCSLFARGEQSSPERVVEAYLEAFKAGDFETMVRLSGGWQGSAEEAEFARNLVGMIELQGYLVGPVNKISDSEALVPVTVTLALYGHDRTHVDQIRVVKKGTHWFIEEGLVE